MASAPVCLADHWGELCGTAQVASAWADRLVGVTRLALSPDKTVRGYFHGTSACLSALFAARRYDELIELVRGDIFWPYKRWAVKAMVAQGRHMEAIAFAEIRSRIRALIHGANARGGYVANIIGREVGLP